MSKKKETEFEQQQRIKKEKFTSLFRTPLGEEVLYYILVDLGFFSKIETEQDKILHNYAHELVELRGGFIQEFNVPQGT